MAAAELSPSVPLAPSRPYRIALVGNPNTGKSTLFNSLAGMRVRTGNYPGVTISKKVGRCRVGDFDVDLIDLPGTYSLAPRSPDELVAVEVLTGDLTGESPIDAIVCVVNATLLQRSLFLVSQVMELGKPVIIAMNMSDTAASRGLRIDTDRLSTNLNVPIVATSGTRREGIDRLRSAIADVLQRTVAATAPHGNPPLRDDAALPAEFYAACRSLRGDLERTACVPVRSSGADAADADPDRSGAASGQPSAAPARPGDAVRLPSDFVLQRMLLDRGGQTERAITKQLGAAVLPAIAAARQRLKDQFGDVVDMECSARYTWASRHLTGVLSQGGGDRGITRWVDAIVTHRVIGLVLFAALMLVIFQSIYSLAGYPMAAIEWVTEAATSLVESSLPPGALRSLIVDGGIAGVGGVLIFLPQIALLFFFLAVLEDCGYMARAAFLIDRVMRLFGLSGKSFLPLMSSFACAVPGIMATRVIENRRDRFATIMIAPLMSCSARLPVYLLLIWAFIPETSVLGFFTLPALVLMAMYAVGVVVAVPVSLLLKRTILRGETAPFVLELPEYKIPSGSVVFQRVWEACREFVVRAGTLIFAASILIWFSCYWPGDHSRRYELQRQIETAQATIQSGVEDPQSLASLESDLAEWSAADQAESARLLENSLLGRVGHAIEPIVRPLGWDWKIGVGALASFPAREVIISTLGTIYSLGGDVDEEDQGLIGTIRAAKWDDGTPVYTIPVALSVMVFFALCAQCVSTLLVIRRETNSWFWPAMSFTYMTVLAYLGALATYQIGSRFWES